MLNTVIAILLLITFVGFIVYIIRGGNVMVGFFVMAILWSVIGMIPFNSFINNVVAQPTLKFGSTIVYIIFGSWFGQVLVDSGIAGSVSEQTQKVGKKSPVFALILMALVTSLIFISAFGVGSVIAIGVILLPVMHSIGVPKKIGVSVFTLSIGAAMYVNVVLFNQIRPFFPSVKFDARYLKFGWTAMAVQLVVIIIFILLNAKKIRDGAKNPPTTTNYNNNATDQVDKDPQNIHVSKWTYVIPVVPVVMNMAFNWDAVPSLLFATLLAMLMTGKFRHYSVMVDFLNKTIQESISNIAGLIMFLLALVMFSAAALQNADRFAGIFKTFIPHSPLVLAVAIGILAPLALFRGPLHVWGAGAATAVVLSGVHLFSPFFLLPVLYIPSILAVSSDITQSWNAWTIDYTDLDSKTFMLTAAPVAWVAAILNELLAVYFFA